MKITPAFYALTGLALAFTPMAGADSSVADSGVAASSLEESAAAPLAVTVSGFRAVSGTLVVGLYADEADWNRGASFRNAIVEVNGDEVSFTFDDLAPGIYGLKLFQDLDGDNRLDTSGMGIPTEPYGFSNNARGMFGPARWSAASFTISEGENAQLITIR